MPTVCWELKEALAMTAGRWMTRVALALALASVFVSTACGPAPRIEVGWPVASLERAVPRPEARVTWPLTGRPAPDVKTAASRPVVVSIAGDPSGAARPGLDEADLVYEMPSDTGSRFAAVFQSRLPAECGPVTTAIAADLVVAGEYDAVFGHTGSAVTAANGVVDASQRAKGAAYRGSGTAVLADVASLTSAQDASASPAALTFGPTPSAADGAKVTAMDVPFGPGEAVEWRWDVGAAAFVRSVNGKPQDGTKGSPIVAANVVVMWARPSRDTSTGLELVDAGRASVFMDGRRFSGTWKAGVDAPPVLVGDSGRVVALQPGSTWFEVVPTAVNITLR
jgi:hypothetical protein